MKGYALSLVAWALTLLVAPVAADALCAPSFPPRSPESPADYAAALVESLTWAKEGRTRWATLTSDDDARVLLTWKLATEDYRCAAQTLAPFAGSANTFIVTGAGLVASVYKGLVEVNERGISEMVAAMNRAGSGPANLGTLTDRLTNLAVFQDQMWRQLPNAVAVGMYGIVKFGEQGQATDRLRLRRAQRAQLLRSLESGFGTRVRHGMQVGQHAVDGAAALLYKQLVEWRAEDE